MKLLFFPIPLDLNFSKVQKGAPLTICAAQTQSTSYRLHSNTQLLTTSIIVVCL